MIKSKQSVPWRTIILYIILFFSTWTLDEFFNKPFLASIMGDFAYEVVRTVIKTAVWVAPCVFLLKKYETVVSISLKDMFTNKVAWLKAIPIFLIFTAYLLIGSYISYGSLAIRDTFNPLDLFGKFLFVGITEEIVFRGWLLNAFIKKTGKLFAIAISTLLFLFIHFPVWIHNGTFIPAITSGSFLIVIVLSVIFSISFIKTKNLLVPILLHMYWDLLMILFWA